MTADAGTVAPPFGAELSKRVHERLDDATLRGAHERLHRKAIVVVAWFVVSYVGILVASSWLMGAVACVSLALAIAGVGFNIQHDANHNALFATASKRLTVANRIAGLSIHVIGGDSKRWIDGHVRQHHAAPNVVGRDHDIELAPFARMAPSQRRRSWHGFQHVYIWFIYAFTTAAIIVGDVVGIIQDSISGDRHGKRPLLRDHLAMATSKGLFVLVMVAVPVWVHSWVPVLLGVLTVLAISGVVLGIVFQLAHVVSEADFCTVDARNEARWHEWQVLASVDFCHGRGPVARLVTWYCGGLNYQTEHHLFPGVPHPAYAVIAPIVADTCAEYEIPYLVQTTLRAAVRSHHRHLRLLGQPTGSTTEAVERCR
jgi:linoleoyl-CoA desaturase